VSGSCEHERIHPGLGAYWWTRANEELPDRILEVQTAFMAWTNPEQTHLHDEHVYENSGRWGAFLRDVRDEITRVGGKPFVMGETIIANAWPDVPALRSLRDEASRCGEGATHAGAGRDARWTDVTPWYLSRGLEECEALERAIVARYGEDVLDRFRRDAHRFGYQLRTWQIERFRTDPRNAGFVTNHIRDVPLCRCGFMDDLARWRYTCDELRGVLGDSAYLLRTPSDRRAFAGGRSLVFELGVSHFGRGRFSAKATLAIAGACETRLVISADPGAVSWVQSEIVLPDVRTPTLCEVMACDESGRRNSWRVWVMPLAPEVPPDVVRLDGLPYSKGDSTPTFEERAYSSGWGLKCATWSPALPMLDEIVFKCPLWRFDAPLPRGTRVVVTHKFTRGLVDFLERGGHVVLLANPTAGGFGAKTVMLWGQVPLVVEEGPLVPGDSAWVVDLLHYDLMRRSQRAVPTEEMGIASEIEPLVRLVFTHDSGKPKVSDALFAARVGEGVLVVSSLDHVDDPGRYLLSRILAWLTGEEAPKVRGTLSGARARAWAIPGSEARGTHWRAAE
jgi:hypothetical protein